MSDTEVVEFKTSDFADKVKDKIKASFVDLIPEEKWDELVKGELEHVMIKEIKDRYGDVKLNKDSIHAMIRTKLGEVIRERINSEIMPLFESHWDSEKQKQVLSDLLKNIVINNADKMFMSIMTDAIQKAMNDIRLPDGRY